jgi:hypothetical protein
VGCRYMINTINTELFHILHIFQSAGSAVLMVFCVEINVHFPFPYRSRFTLCHSMHQNCVYSVVLASLWAVVESVL